MYIGRTYFDCDLKGYCKSKNIKNVVFKGEFKNEDKPKLYEEIDLINSVYGNNSLEVTTALPNKLYDTLLFKKPIIATNNTYLGELVNNNFLGLTLALDEQIETQISEYISNFNKIIFLYNCLRCLDKVLIEKSKLEKYIFNFLRM